MLDGCEKSTAMYSVHKYVIKATCEDDHSVVRTVHTSCTSDHRITCLELSHRDEGDSVVMRQTSTAPRS